MGICGKWEAICLPVCGFGFGLFLRLFRKEGFAQGRRRAHDCGGNLVDVFGSPILAADRPNVDEMIGLLFGLAVSLVLLGIVAQPAHAMAGPGGDAGVSTIEEGARQNIHAKSPRGG